MTGGGNAVAEQNRFSGLVSRVVRDTVMAQVEIQAGPHRLASLPSREAADECSAWSQEGAGGSRR